MADRFCSTFNLGKIEGYKAFCQELLKLRKKFILAFTVNQMDVLFSNYASTKSIKENESRGSVVTMHRLYNNYILERTGIDDNYEGTPDFEHFIAAADIAEEMNVSPEVFLKAQFDELAWTGNPPSLSQISSPKARDRVKAYCYSNGIRANTSPAKVVKVDFKSIKSSSK
jgi:hypothetical protein